MGFPSLHVPLQLAALPAELSTEHQAVQHTPTAELHRIPMMAEWTSPGGSVVKNPPANAGDMGSIPGSGRFPWRRKWPPTPIFLPGKSCGQRRLVGYSPWGHKRVGHNLRTEHNNNIIGTTISFSYTPPPPCSSLHVHTHHSIYLNDLIFTSSLWLA